MKATKLAIALLAATGISAIATPVMAYEAGDWLIRGRILNVNPNDSSGDLFVTSANSSVGNGVTVDSDTIPELDITYMISPNWGVELILGYSEHDVDTVNPAKTAAGVDLGQVINAKALPPTLTLQYHFAPNSNIRPYIGAGINYTYFFDEKVTGPLQGGDASIKMDSSWGLAAQAGVDIAINEDWFVNLDVKYIDMNTTARFSNVALVNEARINVDVNPVVWGLGIGRSF
ncbi:MAG: outer membrane beta-barrel protein [Methylophaga sp.]|nr:outer membrane beta-barrel protein [Methylophaga sp.]